MATIPAEPRHQTERRIFQRMMAHGLFRRVTARLGIDFSGSWWHNSEELIFRALRVCADCPRKGDCRAWLDQERDHENYPPFCPNGPIAEVCRIMDPHARSLAAECGDGGQVNPTLAEILDDPMIRQLMEADGVTADRLRLLLMNIAAAPAPPPVS